MPRRRTAGPPLPRRCIYLLTARRLERERRQVRPCCRADGIVFAVLEILRALCAAQHVVARVVLTCEGLVVEGRDQLQKSLSFQRAAPRLAREYSTLRGLAEFAWALLGPSRPRPAGASA